MDIINRLSKKQIIVILSIFTLALVAIGVVNGLSRLGKIKVTVSTAPSIARVKINGSNVSGTVFYLKPGEYTFSANLEGFKEASNTVTLREGEDNTIPLSLTPKDDTDSNISSQYQDEYLKNEAIAGQETRREGSVFEENNPVVKILPYNGALFTINYGTSKNGKDAIIIIDADSPIYRSYALNYLREQGYEPTDYYVRFPNSINDFSDKTL